MGSSGDNAFSQWNPQDTHIEEAADYDSVEENYDVYNCGCGHW
jgi:hypothetical protein